MLCGYILINLLGILIHLKKILHVFKGDILTWILWVHLFRERPGVVGKKFIVVLDFKHVDAFKQSSLNH